MSVHDIDTMSTDQLKEELKELRELVSSMKYIPEGHRLQIASTSFMFNIVTNSPAFKQLLEESIKLDYVRDQCDPSLAELTEKDALELDRGRYINIPQKTPPWFFLREMADGSASSAGKLIKGPTTYPTTEQISKYWKDKILEKPFEKTHTMNGHMNWGVGYEDPALLHFAHDLKVCVSQVGTIRVDLSLIIKLGTIVFKDKLPSTTHLEVKDKHMLVSPDGLVSKPQPKTLDEQSHIRTTMPKKSEMLGMLEIKCISPFHYMESNDKFLEWTDDMETRQWWNPEDIPFVYVVQMCMQALSGVARFGMNGDKTMWFIRWSPHGVSIFTLPFKYLIRLGIVAALQYFSLIQRVKRLDQLDGMFEYSKTISPNANGTDVEKQLSIMIAENYRILMNHTTHRYLKIDSYPEFDTYHKATQYFKFKVPDMDPETLQVQLPKKTTGIEVNAMELHECMF